MKKMNMVLSIALAACTQAACDSTSEQQVSDDVEVRSGGSPLVITEMFGEPISRDDVVALINACKLQPDDPPQTCTLEWSQPDITKLEYDLTLSCNMLASSSLRTCYQKQFMMHGGYPVQFP